jgi:hypothetical protein
MLIGRHYALRVVSQNPRRVSRAFRPFVVDDADCGVGQRLLEHRSAGARLDGMERTAPAGAVTFLVARARVSDIGGAA